MREVMPGAVNMAKSPILETPYVLGEEPLLLFC